MQKSDIIAYFVWAIMSGRFCPWAILSGNRTYTHNTVCDLNEAFRSKFAIRGGQLMHHIRDLQDYSFETQILSKVRTTQSTVPKFCNASV